MKIKLDCVFNKAMDKALAVLPPKIKGSILRTLYSHIGSTGEVNEIRLRLFGRSSLVIAGRNVPLFLRIREEDMRRIIDAATGGSVYSRREDLERGFVSLGGGVRMGVSLSPSLELPTSVAIRLPSCECENAELIYEEYRKALPRGMIIYSPPGMGKTTAIRSLARLVGERDRISVVAVDERGEFDPSAFGNATVDIISGMSKAEGIEIAKRTLGAELIIADEIGDMAEAEALISVGRGGIPFVITAHANSLDELLSEPAIAILKERGYFGTAIGLSRGSGGTLARVDKL